MIEYGEPTCGRVPTIVSDRLILRGWRPADVEPYADIAAHPEMSLFTGSPRSWQDAWKMVASLSGHWTLRGFGMWCAEDRGTGEFLGRVGLFEGPGWPGIEVAWTIRRDRWNQGLATEGGVCALWHAFTTLEVDRVISLIHPDNAASRRVAEKIGLRYEKTEYFQGFGESTAFYAIDRASWVARN